MIVINSYLFFYPDFDKAPNINKQITNNIKIPISNIQTVLNFGFGHYLIFGICDLDFSPSVYSP